MSLIFFASTSRIIGDELAGSKFHRHATAQKTSVLSRDVIREEKSESKMESAHKQAVKIYVKSKKVAIRSAVVESYSGSFIGPVKTFTRFVDYEDRLDDTQQRMIDYASDLAMSARSPVQSDRCLEAEHARAVCEADL